jgi:hypothetical protein
MAELKKQFVEAKKRGDVATCKKIMLQLQGDKKKEAT